MQLEEQQSEVLRLLAWDAHAAARERSLENGTATEHPLDDVLTKLHAQLQ